MPPASARFVVIGLTNGPAFHPNPCLAAQVDYARSRHLWAAAYAVLTFPTRGQLRTYGGPREAGRAQARQNVAAMRAVGLPSPIVWVDVEPVSPPAPWSPRVRANRAVLDGRARGLPATPACGSGSTPPRRCGAASWGRSAPACPEWRTAGLSTRSAALARCGRRDAFQGGPGVLTQWYSTREDFDVLCPGRPADDVLAEFFTRL